MIARCNRIFAVSLVEGNEHGFIPTPARGTQLEYRPVDICPINCSTYKRGAVQIACGIEDEPSHRLTPVRTETGAKAANGRVQYRLIPRVAIWTQFENYPNAGLVRGSAPRGPEDLPRSLATQLSPRLCASSLEAQDRVPGRRPGTQSMSNGSQTATT